MLEEGLEPNVLKQQQQPKRRCKKRHTDIFSVSPLKHTYFIVSCTEHLNIKADKTKLFVIVWQQGRIYACIFG